MDTEWSAPLSDNMIVNDYGNDAVPKEFSN